MRILAIDPGETSGWAYTDTSAYPGWESKLYHGSFAMWEDLEALIRGDAYSTLGPPAEHPADVVIIERFTLYPWAAHAKVWNEFPTVEVIGVAKYLAERAGARIVMQGADVAKAKWLQKAKVQGNAHERDAQRHLLAFAKREGLDAGYRNFYPRPQGHKNASR